MNILKNYTLRARLDAVSAALAPKPTVDTTAIFDAAADYAAADCKMKVASMVQEWARMADGDLDDGETSADRLFAMMVGCVDADKNGDLDDAEAEMLTECLETAYDYLSGKGVEGADIDALLNDGDDEAAGRVREMLSGGMDGMDDDGMADDVDTFAFSEEKMDAAYKKVTAFRKGRKVRINKRVSGTVRLSAKQKMGIRKALRKANSAQAMMRRARTNRTRRKAGM